MKTKSKEYLCPGCAASHLDVFLVAILLKEKKIKTKNGKKK